MANHLIQDFSAAVPTELNIAIAIGESRILIDASACSIISEFVISMNNFLQFKALSRQSAPPRSCIHIQ
jgi:hypothetical protein